MIDTLVDELLAEPITDGEDIVFTEKAIRLIHEITEQCKGIRTDTDMAENYKKNMTAEQVYMDMLCKIIIAPTTLHMKGTVRLLIPIIDQKLRERGL